MDEINFVGRDFDGFEEKFIFFTVAACAAWNNVNNSLGQIWYGLIQDEKNADFFH